jgi:hypothetical protein
LVSLDDAGLRGDYKPLWFAFTDWVAGDTFQYFGANSTVSPQQIRKGISHEEAIFCEADYSCSESARVGRANSGGDPQTDVLPMGAPAVWHGDGPGRQMKQLQPGRKTGFQSEPEQNT